MRPLGSSEKRRLAALTVLAGALLASCASNRWRLELSNHQAATGVTDTFRFTQKELLIRRKNDSGGPSRVILRRDLADDEIATVLSAIGLFHQARTAKWYKCREVPDGQILRVVYDINSHYRSTSLYNVYLEPVGTLIRSLVPLLPDEPRLTYFLINRPAPEPGDPSPPPEPPCQ